jgi:hypothetical protein
MRLALVVLLALALIGPPRASLAQTLAWPLAPRGATLTQPAFWEDAPGVTATADGVSISGSNASTLVVDRYGPRVHLASASSFAVTASLQAADADLAALVLLDGTSPDQWGPLTRRVEVGLQAGQLAFGVFDGTSAQPSTWETFTADAPGGPTIVSITRDAGMLALAVSGAEVARASDPGVFQTGTALFGAHVAAGNQLILGSLEIRVPQDQLATTTIDRCTPTRLLAGGTDDSNQHDGLWWVWPDDGYIRDINPDNLASDYVVAFSPDGRWVAYYQGPDNYNPATDRFVVDTWVMDLETDERTRLVSGNTPIGWISDSSALVLGERPMFMTLVPTGEVVPTQGNLLYAQSMRAADSPDGKLRAAVVRTPQGAAGISILDNTSGSEVAHINTGRGAPQLAWAPDSARLAYTSGNDSPAGLIWKLRTFSPGATQPALVGAARDLSLHSVLWAPPLPGC